MTARHTRYSLLLAAAALAATTLAVKEWTASLRPVGESMIRGTATASTIPGDSLVITINVDGITMVDEFPWHLHAGACGQVGAVIGGASSYPLIRPTGGRDGTASARVKVTLDADADYSVNVHRSTSDMTAIACGTLLPAMAP